MVSVLRRGLDRRIRGKLAARNSNSCELQISRTGRAGFFIHTDTKFTNQCCEPDQTSGETNVRSKRERQSAGDIGGKIGASCDDHSETFAAKRSDGNAGVVLLMQSAGRWRWPWDGTGGQVLGQHNKNGDLLNATAVDQVKSGGPQQFANAGLLQR